MFCFVAENVQQDKLDKEGIYLSSGKPIPVRGKKVLTTIIISPTYAGTLCINLPFLRTTSITLPSLRNLWRLGLLDEFP